MWCTFAIGLEAAAIGALTAPSGLNTTAVKATSFTLRWSAATGGVGGISSYTVYRDGTAAGSTATRTFTVSGLSPVTSYNMTIVARDGAGNSSLASSVLPVTTGPNTTLPSKPIGLTASATTTTSFTLTWSPSTDDVGITGYNVYRSGIIVGSSITTSFVVTGLAPNTNNQMTVRAVDASGNLSAASPALLVKTLANPPSTPTNLTAINVMAASFTLKWTASTGGTGGIVAYDIYQGGVLIGSRTTVSFAVTALTPLGIYSMTVVSRDASGHVSEPSAPLVVTTIADTLKPTPPIGLNATNITATSFVLNWTPSTDNVGVKAYDVYKLNTLLGSTTSTSFTVAGLAPLSTTSVKVKARDAAGNVSSFSAVQAVTTTAIPNVPPTVVITFPSNNTIFTRPTAINLTASAADSDGTIIKVEFFDGQTKLGESAIPAAPSIYAISCSITSVGPHVFTARATDNRNAMVQSATVSTRLLASLPYVADFEISEGYVAGPLNNQNGWTVSAGLAQVTATDAAHGEQSVVLEGGATATLVDQEYGATDGNPSPIFFDLLAKPVAGSNVDSGTVFDIDNARIAFVINGPDGQFSALDGDGAGAGTWKVLPATLPLVEGNTVAGWQRITVRLDYAAQTWDFYLNSRLIASDLKFRFNGASFASGLSIKGPTSGRTALDDIYAGVDNPLFVDANKNGIDDAWEIAHGLSLFSNNRLSDPDGDGLTNLQEYQTGSDPQDYYNGSDPVITVVAGDGQSAAPGQFNQNPLIVVLTKPDGSFLVNAPVTFRVANEGGLLAANQSGSSPLFNSIGLTTNSEGKASLYFKQPTTANITSHISASAKGAQCDFTTDSLPASTDVDADGLPDAWEQQNFGTLAFGPDDFLPAIGMSTLDCYNQNLHPAGPPIVSAGLRCWFSADYGVSADNSNHVNVWADASGNGFHLTQPEASKRPAYYSSGEVNPFNSIYFENIHSLVSSEMDLLNGSTDLTVLIVCRPAAQQLEAAHLLSFGKPAAPVFELQQNNSTTNEYALRWQQVSDQAQNGNAIAATGWAGNPQLLTFIKSGLTQSAYQNGILQKTGKVLNTDVTQLGQLVLAGGLLDSSQDFRGEVYEVLVYNRALTSVEREQIETSLVSWYNLDDTDGNGLPDSWERKYFGHTGVNPSADSDNDGVTNLQEVQHLTDPNNADSDGDGLSDGQEIALGMDPNNPTAESPQNITWLSRRTTDYTPATRTEIQGFFSEFREFDWMPRHHAYNKMTVNLSGYWIDRDGNTGTQEPSMHSYRFNNHLWEYEPATDTAMVARLALDYDPDFPPGYEQNLYINSARQALLLPTSSQPPHYYVQNGEITSNHLKYELVTDRDSYYNKRYFTTYDVTLSDEPPLLVVPGVRTTTQGPWFASAPTASYYADSNYGESNEATVYQIFVPAGARGTIRWLVVFTTDNDAQDKTYAINSWTIDGIKSPEFTLDPRILNPGINGSYEIILLDAAISADSNRDGTIVPATIANIANASIDETSSDHPYRFWLNDDDDHGSIPGDIGTEHVPIVRPDYTTNLINSQRDLEDYARLWISLAELQSMLTAPNANLQIGLKWANVSSGAPAIKIFPAVETDGGTAYLTDGSSGGIAQQQASQYAVIDSHYASEDPGSSTHTTIGVSDVFILSKTLLANLSTSQPTLHLLFEGCSVGKGQLKIVILDARGTPIGEGPGVWMDLQNVKSMYERVKVTPRDPSGIPAPFGSTTTFDAGITSTQPSDDGYSFAVPADETQTALVFVHGSNIPYEEARWNAETMLKRLWWQGYKGRFVLFYWDTLVGPFDGTLPAPYNLNEYRSWKYGYALNNYVANSLPSGYTKNIIGHSLGNGVLVSALREGMVARNVVLMQAAMPASCFDSSAQTLAGLVGVESQMPTPDTTSQMGYRGVVEANLNATLSNIYNENDFALGWWVTNQENRKPEVAPDFDLDYYYTWTASGGGQLWKYNAQGNVNPPAVHYFVTDSHESMAFIARSRTTAAGRMSVGGSIGNNLNVSQDTELNFGDTRPDHSGEFTRAIQQLGPFYRYIFVRAR